MTSLSLNTQTVQKKDSVAIFGDIQNVLSIVKYGDVLLDFAKMQGNVKLKKFYYNSQHKNQVDAKNIFQLLGFNCVDVPDSSKNSADKQLKDECYNAVAFNPSLTTIILLSGDGDFAVLIAILKAMGKKVIVFARRGSTSKRLINLVGAENFHFIDDLPALIERKTQPQINDIHPQISYNDAVKYLVKAVKKAISQNKPTNYSYLNELMRKFSPHYHGISSISTPDGKKLKTFGQFVDMVVKEGKIIRQNQHLFLVELNQIAA
ncbi:MAG: NYN domain-containing protein [Nostocales cyanobacterium]|nr:MAG: NYN domain-containing protein [Nostocales cyanobacterium]